MNALQILERLNDVKDAQRSIPRDAEDRWEQLNELEGRGEELMLMLEAALEREAH